MSGRKLSNYISAGFIKNNLAQADYNKSTELVKIRSFYQEKNKIERVVFDLSSEKLTKTIVYISNTEKKVIVTMDKVKKSESIVIPAKTLMFSTYKAYQLDSDSLIVEMTFKRHKEIDVFFLEKPARLVIDTKVLENK